MEAEKNTSETPNLPVPSIGRIVHYNLTEKEKEVIQTLGFGGNSDKLPAIIVSVWGSSPKSAVNLKVFIDGRGEFWKTSICVATTPGTPGQWEWPQR